jgi:hypothetical protein
MFHVQIDYVQYSNTGNNSSLDDIGIFSFIPKSLGYRPFIGTVVGLTPLYNEAREPPLLEHHTSRQGESTNQN